MRKILLSFSVLAVVIAFAACKKSSNSAPSNNAAVMFVHGCAAGATPITVDAKANNVAVANATNMAFLKNSGYQTVTAGSEDLSFAVTGLSALTSGTETLTANSHYTAFAGGSILAPSFVFTSDDLSAPPSGDAKIRFINLSADNLNTSCYFGATKLDSNIGSLVYTPFINVTSNTAKLAMIDQTVLTSSGELVAQTLVAGKIYTAMLTGSSTGTGTSVLTLTLINNN